jgi:LacI family transcriptional regulator
VARNAVSYAAGSLILSSCASATSIALALRAAGRAGGRSSCAASCGCFCWFVPKILREYYSDGLLINYTDHIPMKLIDLIMGSKIPSVWLNTRRAADCIHPDDLDLSYRATRHLLSRGYRRIAYADYSHGDLVIADAHYSARERLEGYRRAMTEAGLAPRVIREKRRPRAPRRSLHALLAGAGRSSGGGRGLQRTRRAAGLAISLDLRLTRPVEVVCFGNEQVRLVSRAIPTMLVPQKRMGQEAVDMLLQKTQDPSARLAPRPVPFDFVDETGELAATETIT